MPRLIELLLLASVVCRLAAGRWPWAYARRWPRQADAARAARALLGLGPAPSRAAIIAAHREKMLSAHPDRGGNDAYARELNAARELLLQPFSSKAPSPSDPEHATER